MLEIIFQGFIAGLVIFLLFCWCPPLYLFFCLIIVKNLIVSGEIVWLITLWPIITILCLPKSIKDKWQKETEIRKKSKKQKPTIVYRHSNSTTKKTTATKNPSYKTVSYTRKPTKEEIKRERNKMTAKVRERILMRDNYTCQICGLSRKDEPHLALHVDHIIPVSKGGKTVDSNLQCLCWQCNLKKSNKTP